MSEIRSQATPARDSGLTDALRDAVGDNYDHGRNPNLTGQLWHEDGIRDSIDWAGAARDLEREGWSKPRTVNSAAELNALEEGSVILDARGEVLHWIDRGDYLQWSDIWGNECGADYPATVLFTPGEAV